MPRPRAMSLPLAVGLLLLLAAAPAPASAATCKCTPPSDDAIALGYWDDAPPNLVAKQEVGRDWQYCMTSPWRHAAQLEPSYIEPHVVIWGGELYVHWYAMHPLAKMSTGDHCIL